MSAAKMVADSTQGDLPEKTSVKRKKSTEKKKAKKKKVIDKKVKRKDNSQEEYDECDLDLENDLKPIGSYVGDRAQMLDQMFHCVKGASLQRALPDVLKELTLEELKQRCLEELQVMSKKRITRILAGDDPGNISSSGTEDEDSEDEKPTGGPLEEQATESRDFSVAADSTSHGTDSEASDRDAMLEGEEEKKGQSSPESGEVTDVRDYIQVKSSKQEMETYIGEACEEDMIESPINEKGEIIESEEGDNSDQGKDNSYTTGEPEERMEGEEDREVFGVQDEGEIEEEEEQGVEHFENADEKEEEEDDEEEEEAGDMSISEELVEEVQGGGSVSAPVQSLAPVLTRNQMELLELEMRARAIKAMLKSQS